MKPIFPRPLMLLALAGLLLGAFSARAETTPRPLDEVRADMATLDPYAPDFDATIDRLIAEERAARLAARRMAGLD